MLDGIARWEVITAWILRAGLAASGIAFLVEHRWAFGAFCLVALALVVTPSLISRTTRFIWPIEIELLLLLLITAHATVGYLFGLYAQFALFDKVLHFGDSLLIGFFAFLAVYIAHYVRADRSHPWIDALTILLFTLGIGAIWEIVEFLGDTYLGTHAQGGPGDAPLPDTMWDLIADATGGVIASVLGPVYMQHSRRSRERAHTFAKRLEATHHHDGDPSRHRHRHRHRPATAGTAS